jgi:anti-sigma regulatory factor (Ser/Thr protein kinase)
LLAFGRVPLDELACDAVGALPEGYRPRWKLDMRGLHSALAEDAASPDRGVDLSRVDFVTPGGMVGLACLLEGWIAEHESVHLILPDEGITGYLHRMDFFRHFEERITTDRDVSYLDTRGRGDASLSELQRVQEPEDVIRVTKQFGKILAQGSLGDAEVRRCQAVLSEGMNNALDHARSASGAYTAIQPWARLGTVAVAIADAGVGIPQTIREHPDVPREAPRDYELIEFATRHLVSSKHDETGRGGGFTCALTSVGNGHGRMKIWSGEGWVELSGISEAGVGLSIDERPARPFGGTCVEVVFPLS